MNNSPLLPELTDELRDRLIGAKVTFECETTAWIWGNLLNVHAGAVGAIIAIDEDNWPLVLVDLPGIEHSFMLEIEDLLIEDGDLQAIIETSVVTDDKDENS